MSDTLSPGQVRGARGILGWSKMDLARAAGVSLSTVKRVEGDGLTRASTRLLVRRAFESVGVVFALDRSLGEGIWHNRSDAPSPPVSRQAAERSDGVRDPRGSEDLTFPRWRKHLE